MLCYALMVPNSGAGEDVPPRDDGRVQVPAAAQEDLRPLRQEPPPAAGHRLLRGQDNNSSSSSSVGPPTWQQQLLLLVFFVCPSVLEGGPAGRPADGGEGGLQRRGVHARRRVDHGILRTLHPVGKQASNRHPGH